MERIMDLICQHPAAVFVCSMCVLGLVLIYITSKLMDRNKKMQNRI